MAEEATLHLRYQAKEAGLRSLTKRYLAFSNAIESNTIEECEATYAALCLEIAQYEFAVSKASSMVDTNMAQVAEYDAMQQDVEAMMCVRAPSHAPRPGSASLTKFPCLRHGMSRNTTKDDIERLTSVLEQERTIRQQKEQYSALARRIHAYPSRSDTQAEIERLEADIATLKGESDTVASALELRSKRFAGFMHALHDMQLLLESEQAATPMVQ